MIFIGAIMSAFDWNDLPLLDKGVNQGASDCANRIIELGLLSLLSRQNNTLEGVIYNFCIAQLQEGNLFSGLLLYEGIETGALDRRSELEAIGSRVRSLASKIINAKNGNSQRGDALYAVHFLDYSCQAFPSQSNALLEAVSVDQPHALHEYAEHTFFSKTNSLEEYIKVAQKAVQLNHKLSSLYLVERLLKDKEGGGAMYTKSLSDAVENLIRYRQDAGLIDAALIAEKYDYSLFIAAALSIPQAIQILSSQGGGDDCMTNYLKVLVESQKDAAEARCYLQQAAAIKLLEQL